MYLTRDLVNEPASSIKPANLAGIALEIEKESKGAIDVEVLSRDECENMGMGAFLGVAQGSEVEPKFIVLKYKGSKAKKLCLIGKSITFDSGGLSLKPSESMEDMKIDMTGGATVLGIFKILGKLVGTPYEKEIGYEIVGLLPACENMPSGKALRPGDIIRAMDGTTIEVLNTDAEGRLALADAISYAEKYLKPDMIIDLATLTGACMVALGNDITGAFGNNEAFMQKFLTVAKAEGDEAWQLPLHQPYAKLMKSDIADLKNIGGGRYGGAITAALFLSHFVKTKQWIHLDIAGPAHRSGPPQGILPKGATGWGIQTLLSFIMGV